MISSNLSVTITFDDPSPLFAVVIQAVEETKHWFRSAETALGNGQRVFTRSSGYVQQGNLLIGGYRIEFYRGEGAS